MPRINLFLFGAPRLEREDLPVQMDTRKAIALLAYLAVTREPHTRDTLATLLWPHYDQTHARAAFRRTLSTLNAALESDQLEIEREVISLTPNLHFFVDVDVFQNRLAACQIHDHPSNDVCGLCAMPLSEAVALYRNDFMAGFSLRDSPAFDDWQFLQAENLRRDCVAALEKLVRYHTAHNELDIATVYARRWLELDPLQEPAHRHLMRLYAWTNQRAAALRQYEECVRVLQKELDVPPLDETTRLYRAIKENKLVYPQVHRASSSTTLHAIPLHPFPLVGRADELSALQTAYANINVDGQLIVLEGEAGIGKTRLAEEFLSFVRDRNAVTLTARCYEGEANLAYGLFIDVLRAAINQPELKERFENIPAALLNEAARLLPELASSTNFSIAPLDSPGAQSRFFESVSQVLALLCRGESPGIIFCDDLQGADSFSLDLLAYIVQRLRGRPLCVIATWRSDPTPAVDRMQHLVDQAHRAGYATIVRLSRLNETEVQELLASINPDKPQFSSLAARLYRETEGLPFFIVEYLNALEKQPATNEAWDLPGGVRALLHSRLAAVSEMGKQLLSAAAVIGRSFEIQVLQKASGRSEEETVQALEELTAHGLIQETSAPSHDRSLSYDFAHEKLRTLAYAETSPARRQLLHRRVADALVSHAHARHATSGLARQIAYHYQMAGEATSAAEYFKLAGDHARALFAHSEALAHFRMALALGHPSLAELHEAIGDMQTFMGDYSDALTSYTTAAAHCAPDACASIEHKRGSVHHRRGEWEQAEQHFQLALDAFNETTPLAARARLFADWSLSAHQSGQPKRAFELAQHALVLAKEANDACALAQAHNILGILAKSQDDLEQARKHLEQSLQHAEAINDQSARTAALNNLALVLGAGGDLQRAIRLEETALALCTTQGDQHRQAALHNNLADLLHAAGKSEEAMAHLKQAVALFAEIGADAGTLQPEIWKLTEW